MLIKAFFNPIGESDSNNRFEGSETIDIELTRASNRIVFHCDNSIRILDTIQITSVSNNQGINVRTNQHRYIENQLYEILLDQNLPNGNYKLKLDYQGDFGSSTNIIGFYKTSYQEDGVIKYFIYRLSLKIQYKVVCGKTFFFNFKKLGCNKISTDRCS